MARRGKFFVVDKQFCFVMITPHQKLGGRNSVVECHLAKVDVASSNLVYRSILRV